MRVGSNSNQPPQPSEQIRNIGIIAHVDAGKTTTTERILYYSGVIHKLGEIDDGNTAMDWMEQERERGITITSAATQLAWNSYTINLIDTPGHVDFTSEVERALRVLDGAIVVFDANNGVEPQSETVWKQADRYRLPRIIFINKMDKIGADFTMACESVRTKLGGKVLPLMMPIGSERDFGGVVDLLRNVYIVWNKQDNGKTWEELPVPDEHRVAVDRYRDVIYSTLADYEDEVSDHYLADGAVPLDLCKKVIRRMTVAQQIFPALCGSSLKNIGVQPILDAVCDFFASPCELSPLPAMNIDGTAHRPIERCGRQLAGIIFKIVHEKTLGSLSYVRMYSGTLRVGDRFYNVNRACYERVLRIVKVHADSLSNIREIQSGEIGAIIGLKHSFTGDTISTPNEKFLLEKMVFPQPVISIALEPESNSQRDELMQVLQMLAIEDPTIVWKDDEETGELVISGMGELHLNVTIKKIIDEHRIPVAVGKPQVSYRETLQSDSTVTETIHHTIGETSHTIKLSCTLTPHRAEGVQHTNIDNELQVMMPHDLMSDELRTHATTVVEQILRGGFRYGFPVINTKVTITVDELDSKHPEQIIAIALHKILMLAAEQASPQLNEPIMAVTIGTPTEYVGDVVKCLQQRSGVTNSIEDFEFERVVYGEAPMNNLFGFATQIRSASKGRAVLSIEFSHYEVTGKKSV